MKFKILYSMRIDHRAFLHLSSIIPYVPWFIKQKTEQLKSLKFSSRHMFRSDFNLFKHTLHNYKYLTNSYTVVVLWPRENLMCFNMPFINEQCLGEGGGGGGWYTTTLSNYTVKSNHRL